MILKYKTIKVIGYCNNLYTLSCFSPNVYVENSGFGATWAVPIASLMIEKYLHRSIAPNRLYLEKRMMESVIEPKEKKEKKK